MRRPRFTIASLLVFVLFLAFGLAALRDSTELWDAPIFGVTLLLLVTSVLLAVHRAGSRRAYWLGFALCGGAYLAATLIEPIQARLPTTKALAYLDSMVPGRQNSFTVTLGPSLGSGPMPINAAAFTTTTSPSTIATPPPPPAASPAAATTTTTISVATPTPPPAAAISPAPTYSTTGVSVAMANSTWVPTLTPNTTRVWNLSTGNLLLTGGPGSTENFLKIGHSLLALIIAFLGGHLSRYLWAPRQENVAVSETGRSPTEENPEADVTA